TENAGHYGLALTHYTHFTSPIRRYPDLMVHRLIKNRLHTLSQLPRQGISPKGIGPDQANLQCSTQERTAMELERKVHDIKKARFMVAFLGEAFTARITAVTSNGFYVRLEFSHVEGLVTLESLPRDSYRVDEKLQIIS